MSLRIFKFSLILVSVLVTLGLALAGSTVEASEPLLIKAADKPEIYFVSGRTNQKKLILNEQVFYSYGNRWAWVKTVSHSELESYPNVRLVRLQGDSEVYYISGTTKRLIPNEQIFTERGFSWFDVLDINSIEFNAYTTGTPLTSARTYVTSAIPENRKVPSTVRVTQLEARRDSRIDQGTVAAGTSITALRLALRPSESREIYVSRVILTVYGLDNETTGIRSVYLTDSAGRRLSNSQSPVNGRVVFDLANTPITLAARGETQINAVIEASTGGGYVGLRLDSGGLITTTATNVTGVFPIRGPLYYVEPAGRVGGRVIATLYNTQSDVTVVAGTRRQLLAKLVMHEETGDMNVRLSQLRLTQSGSATTDNIRSLELVDMATGRTISARGRLNDGVATFTTTGRDAAIIPALGTRTIGVYADVREGFYETVILQIASANDITIVPEGVGISARVPVVVNNRFISSESTTTIVEGNVTAYLSRQGQSARQRGTEGLTADLGTITLKTKSVPAVIYGLHVKVDTSGNERALQTIVIKDRSGDTIASASARPMIDGASYVEFDQPIRLNARQTYTFTLYGETRSSAVVDDTVRLQLTDFQIRNADGTAEGAGWLIETRRLHLID